MDYSLLRLMEEIDEQLKEEKGELNFFRTPFGLEFEENYLDLMIFVDAATLIPTFAKPALRLSQVTKSGEIFDHIKKGSEIAENLSSSQKEQVEQIFTQMKDLWHRLGQITATNNESYKTPEIEDVSEEDTRLEDFLGELQLLPRIIAYIIFALYSYIDVYSMNLVKFILSVSDVEEFYRILNQFKLGQNPHNRINDILKDTDIEHLFEPIKHLLKTGHWEDHQKAFADLIVLRNQVAHRKPLTTRQEFHKKFPKFSKIAKQEREKVRSMLKKEIFLDFYRDLLLDVFTADTVETFFMIRQLSTSCYRYLALIDNLVVNWVEEHLNMELISITEDLD